MKEWIISIHCEKKWGTQLSQFVNLDILFCLNEEKVRKAERKPPKRYTHATAHAGIEHTW